MKNEEDEHVIQPGEDQGDLIITIRVNQYGESQLGVNRNEIPVEVLYFYLQFMATTLIMRHQQQVATEHSQRQQNSIVVPQQQLLIQ